MTLKRKRPWRMFYPLGLIILLGILWSIYWAFASNGAKDAMAKARTDLAQQGMTLTCAQESWGGFPFRIEFTCDKPQIAAQGVTANAQALHAVVMAYDFRHILGFVDGPTEFKGIGLTHGRARLSLRVGQNQTFDFAAEVPQPSVPGFASAEAVNIAARRRGAVLDLSAQATAPSLAGAALERVQIIAATDAAILDAPEPLSEAARSGQELDIKSAELSGGGVALTAKGKLRLDSARRPEGSIMTETDDIDKLLALVAPVAGLSDATRSAISSMLSILAKDPASKRRSAELIAKDGELYWGPFKLADLKPLQ